MVVVSSPKLGLLPIGGLFWSFVGSGARYVQKLAAFNYRRRPPCFRQR